MHAEEPCVGWLLQPLAGVAAHCTILGLVGVLPAALASCHDRTAAVALCCYAEAVACLYL